MFAAEVVGNVVSTHKDSSLVGSTLLFVAPLDKDLKRADNYLVAVDSVGAGVGERVLVARGSSARKASKFENSPIDLAIVGIIDEMNIDGETY